ncbi:alpha,alpha-trehalose-phosphate synthase (UDP-forming) [Alkalilimnicola ehrlichii]|uniref:alpha,alpha-trehalose-phosphate synthase (UDP-forming) n=1 Tax=Alkalilimnicola ehrlichii TaxID=351052 RepID=UPI003BA0BC37
MSLITISNRVALPSQLQGAQGGLAVGLRGALEDGGGLWFGWDGRHEPRLPDPRPLAVQNANGVRYATLRLTRAEYERFYLGFSNQVLWPLFHYRLPYVHCQRADREGYWAVNRLFADRLPDLPDAESPIWIHDYHFIPLGQMLRERGITNPLGFFLHTPFPAWDVYRALPDHQALLEALCAHDLVGFQTDLDRDNFLDCLRHTDAIEVIDTARARYRGRVVHIGVFPIGIDVDSVAAHARHGFYSQQGRRLQASLGDRRLIIGVDRLDYSKGLDIRFEAYRRMLERRREHRARVVYLQIAPISRGEVPEYDEIRRELEYQAGHLNCQFAEYDWAPLRYLNRGFHRANVLGFLSRAHVGLVTPMRDGMNLVAKEFVAAQDPDDPGVLVLSHLAGAARELDAAVLVNPYDPDEVAERLHQALTMPLAERRERWTRMIRCLREQDITCWRDDYLQALQTAAGASG